MVADSSSAAAADVVGTAFSPPGAGCRDPISAATSPSASVAAAAAGARTRGYCPSKVGRIRQLVLMRGHCGNPRICESFNDSIKQKLLES